MEPTRLRSEGKNNDKTTLYSQTSYVGEHHIMPGAGSRMAEHNIIISLYTKTVRLYYDTI